LVRACFLAFAAEGGAMRVPSPAAGTMTKTFIGAISIVQGAREMVSRLNLGSKTAQHLPGDDFRYLPVVTARD